MGNIGQHSVSSWLQTLNSVRCSKALGNQSPGASKVPFPCSHHFSCPKCPWQQHGHTNPQLVAHCCGAQSHIQPLVAAPASREGAKPLGKELAGTQPCLQNAWGSWERDDLLGRKVSCCHAVPFVSKARLHRVTIRSHAIPSIGTAGRAMCGFPGVPPQPDAAHPPWGS